MKSGLMLLSSCLTFVITLTNAATLICPPIDKQGKPDISRQALKSLEQCIKQTPSTKSLYFNNKIKQYSIKRQRLHDKIMAEILLNKPCPTQSPIALLTGGLPGAGKTTYLQKKMPWVSAKNFVVIDADALREKLPEYKGWNAKNTQPEIHDLEREILAKLTNFCPYNLVYDSSMSNTQFFSDFIHELKGRGYRVYIVYVQIPLKIAISRAKKRYLSSGRYVSSDFLTRVAQNGMKTFAAVKNEVDGYVIIDGETSQLLQQGGKKIPTSYVQTK